MTSTMENLLFVILFFKLPGNFCLGKLKRAGEGEPRKGGDKVLTCDRTKNGQRKNVLFFNGLWYLVGKAESRKRGKTEKKEE
jgi:hypothetical protein